MKKPSRLFWKFVVVFWLAVASSFAGMRLLMVTGGYKLSGPDFNAFRADVMLTGLQTELKQHGASGAILLIDAWREQGISPLIELRDSSSQLLTAAACEGVCQGTRIEVQATDGKMYQLTTNATAKRQENPPSIAFPIVSAIAVSLIFSIFLAWYLAHPVEHLRDAMRAAGAGNLDARIQPLIGNRRDEIADLGKDFDAMAAQLQQLIGAQQRLLHDISHELRSPLARLQVAIGLMDESQEERLAIQERILREADRLDALVEELLTLSRLEAGISEPKRERVDIVELLHSIADDAAFEAEAKQCRVNFNCEAKAFVSRVNGELIYRALENVVRNAVKYTRPNTQINIDCRSLKQGDELEICVQDEGPGIPVEMLSAIFEPFYRFDHGDNSHGFGLGLAIAQRAVRTHGGSIQADAAENGGLRIRILLPRSEAYA